MSHRPARLPVGHDGWGLAWQIHGQEEDLIKFAIQSRMPQTTAMLERMCQASAIKPARRLQGKSTTKDQGARLVLLLVKHFFPDMPEPEVKAIIRAIVEPSLLRGVDSTLAAVLEELGQQEDEGAKFKDLHEEVKGAMAQLTIEAMIGVRERDGKDRGRNEQWTDPRYKALAWLAVNLLPLTQQGLTISCLTGPNPRPWPDSWCSPCGQ